MRVFNKTIKSRLITTAIGISIILILLGIIINYYLQSTFSQHSLLSKIEKLNSQELKLRKLEKSFLLEETSNSDFYKTENSKLINEFYTKLKEVEEDIRLLQNNKFIKDLGLYNNLVYIENGFKNYNKNFEKLRKLILEKGFKDYGLIGNMRGQIHSVESIVEEQNNLLYSKFMLTLRRHEKDYLLRKDLKYKKKFDHVISAFQNELSKDKSGDKAFIKTYLTDYQHIFHQVIKKDIKIGLKEDKGLMKMLNDDVKQIEENLSYVYSGIFDNSKQKISKAVITLFGIIILLSSLILVILYRDAKHIVSSIKKLRKYISRLGKGELPEKIKVLNSDEISDMKKSINILTDNLKRTRDFVIEVGNGNFEKEINVFNGKGELGANLVSMRKKLLQVSKEKEQQNIESERRIWNNEGLGMFSEILRKNNDNIEELSFQVIKNLVKYLNANQGGFFIKTQENSEFFYDLKAAFAYDRKKYANKRVKLKEGILGACAMERETSYLTDIPDNYIEITSGLGSANPRSLLIVPLKREDEVLGMLEIASFKEFEKFEIDFAEKIAENVASQLFFVQMNIRTNKLYEQTLKQAEEMREQEEEMRQNVEELTVTQERLASREEELLLEIENLNIKNKELFRELAEFKSREEETYYPSMEFQN